MSTTSEVRDYVWCNRTDDPQLGSPSSGRTGRVDYVLSQLQSKISRQCAQIAILEDKNTSFAARIRELRKEKQALQDRLDDIGRIAIGMP